jgi:hypothetical protein
VCVCEVGRWLDMFTLQNKRQLLWVERMYRYTANKRWHWSTFSEQRTDTNSAGSARRNCYT